MELKNKTIAFLGDSITFGTGVDDPEHNRYDNIIKERCSLKATYNYGIGGTRLAHQRVPSEKPKHDLCFCGRAYCINPDADIIIIYGGTNDYGHGDAPFGTLTDKTPATFCGGVDFLMTFLKDTYPNAQLLFLAPAKRLGCGEKSQHPSKTADARVLKEYVDVIIAKGKEYDIPVLSLYDELGIDPDIESDREKYTTDGLHFNDDGHRVIANCVINFLQNL